MPAPTPALGAPGPSRRTVLRAVAIGGSGILVAATGGCGIRLESAAPVTAAVATRQPMPDEALLQALAARAERLAGRATGAGRAEIAARHNTQAQVCRSLLAAAGAPSPAGPTATTTATSPATATTNATAPAPGTAGDLAIAAAEAARDDVPWSAVAGAGVHRRLAVSLGAHDAATATLLSAPVPWPATAQPPEGVARAQLEPARAAAYAVEVAVARVTPAQRDPLTATLTALRRRVDRLTVAAGGAPGAPLGYTVPFPVESRADAERLAATVLAALVARGLDGLDTVTSVPAGQSPTPVVVDQVVGVLALLTEAVTLAAPWGVAPTPFPGLVLG